MLERKVELRRTCSLLGVCEKDGEKGQSEHIK